MTFSFLRDSLWADNLYSEKPKQRVISIETSHPNRRRPKERGALTGMKFAQPVAVYNIHVRCTHIVIWQVHYKKARTMYKRVRTL